MNNEVLLPGETLGLLGGGQLGRMFAQAAATMGYHVAVLEPGENAPAAEVSLKHIRAAYDCTEGIQELASHVRTVTTEFENVPADTLKRLAELGVRTTPSASAVSAAQDRNVEKAFIEKAGVPTAPHAAVRSEADVEALDSSLFPGILKTARLGYDGKGQARVRTREEALEAFRGFGGVECVLEKMLDLKLEVSVIVCRDAAGDSVVFPVAENHHKNGILAYTVLPARIDEKTAAEAQEHAKRIAQALDYVGVLCVELFILGDGRILANEIAPRPHNSGHATIEACVSSQYEEQVRIAAGLPLGDTTLRSPAVMLNLLGDLWYDAAGNVREPDWTKLLALPGAKLHLYGKAQPRRARKMGHATFVAETQSEALAHAHAAAEHLGLAFADELKVAAR